MGKHNKGNTKPEEEKAVCVFPLPRIEDNALYLKSGEILSLYGVTGSQFWQPAPGRETFFALVYGKSRGPSVQVADADAGRELETLVNEWLKG